jgi:tripartite-type tricarboxylate transporter receptor subunit TctC
MTAFFDRASSALRFVASTAVLALTVVSASAADFDAEKYFKGKTITIIVDFKTGGGTDTEARYFAANWGKFIPGKPRITVSNLFPKPAGRNYVWKAAPDGLTLNFLASADIGDHLTDRKSEFKSSAAFTAIGAHSKRDVILVSRGTVPFADIHAAKGSKTPILMGQPISDVEDLDGKLLGTGLLALWFDAPLKVNAVARSGSNDALLMIERGDINTDIFGSLWYSLPRIRPTWFSKGYVKVIADMSHPDAPKIPNSEIAMPVPNVVDWMTPEQRDLWNGIYLPEVLFGKGIAGPPNMSPELTKTLRDAYANALKDPEFAAGLEKIQGQPIALLTGEAVQPLMEEATEAFTKYLPQFNDIRQQVYDRYFKQ